MDKENLTTLKYALVLYASLGLLGFISWYDIDLFVTIGGVLLTIGIIAVTAAWLYNLR